MGIKEGLRQSISNDELYTPEYAVLPLAEYISEGKGQTIWECCGIGGSAISKVFRRYGFKVIETGLPELDFLVDEPKFDFDIIITNPPFSIKDKIIKRCYYYDKPFALLLPLTSLEGVRRGKMYRKNGIQVLVLDRRVDYSGKGSNWQNTSWFCWKLLRNDLEFKDLSRYK